MSKKTIAIGDKIYVARMVSSVSRRSYVVGVYKSKSKAIAAGKKEKEFRGETKYTPTIWEMKLGQNMDDYCERIA